MSEADAEIRRLTPVGFRTRKLSSRADGSWGGASPVRVGRCRASRNQFSIELVFLCENLERDFIEEVKHASLTISRHHRLGRSKEIKEESE